MNIRIYKTKPIDAGAIQQLMQTVWDTTYPNDEFGITKESIREYTKDWTSKSEINKISDNIRNASNAIQHYVAKDGQKIVGNCVAVSNVLKALYVLPEYQGRGIGTALMKKLNNINTLYVASYTTAGNFYLKHDFRFERSGKVTEKFKLRIPTLKMVKK